jgi:birA, biotin-[acetyl-CoA-carboxylase] ligase region
VYKISANTLFVGQNLVFVPECHSTNTLAIELSQKATVVEGTVVITHHQTKGRGQRGNGWETAAGMNLTFSLLLHPSFLDVAHQFFLTKVISLALIDFLTDVLRKECLIKWPNDIMVEEKKICGILIENNLSSNRISQSVVGIGLNVNQTSFQISTATSMALASSHSFNLNTQLSLLLEKIEGRYLQLRAGKFQELKEAYHQNLYWRGEIHQFETRGEIFSGEIKGVDDLGKLIVHNGSDRVFDLKEIRFVG